MLRNIRTEMRDGSVWLVADSTDMSDADLERMRTVLVSFEKGLLEGVAERCDAEGRMVRKLLTLPDGIDADCP